MCNLNHIHEYVVNRKGDRVGCILGIGDKSGKFALSWSLCNTSIDSFDKGMAIKIAKSRAEYLYNHLPPLPDAEQTTITHELEHVPVSMRNHYIQMIDRCKRYFKVDDQKKA